MYWQCIKQCQDHHGRQMIDGLNEENIYLLPRKMTTRMNLIGRPPAWKSRPKHVRRLIQSQGQHLVKNYAWFDVQRPRNWLPRGFVTWLEARESSNVSQKLYNLLPTPVALQAKHSNKRARHEKGWNTRGSCGKTKKCDKHWWQI